MKCTVLLFGITREVVGSGKTQLNLDKGVTVSGLMDMLKAQYPSLRELNQLLVAVNNEYAEDDTVLSENDEIALIPPVSGG